MTPNEFRAWLEGYSASFNGGYPNKEQWQTIKAKMGLAYGNLSNISTQVSPDWRPQMGQIDQVGPQWRQ